MERRVTCTRKDQNGNITALCTPGMSWSPRMKDDAISDIELGLYTYFVQWPEKRTEIHVVYSPTGKYLRTDRDVTIKNNLHDLPDC